MQQFLAKVSDAGKLYGMDLHRDEFQLLQVQCEASILKPAGELEPKQSINYLGSVLITMACLLMSLADDLAWQRLISWSYRRCGNIRRCASQRRSKFIGPSANQISCAV